MTQVKCFKSSYSVGENNCVHVGGQPEFFKSSYSVQNACVYVASPKPEAILVIDSKQDAGSRDVLAVAPSAYSAFVASLKV